MGRNVARFGSGGKEWIVVDFPVQTPLYHTYEEIDSTERRARGISFRELYANRSFAGYQPGEFLLFYEYGSKERIRLAQVMDVFHETNRFNEYYPKWRVRVVNKNGLLAQNWKYVVPGEIYRAHFQQQDRGLPDVRRALPATLDKGWIDL